MKYTGAGTSMLELLAIYRKSFVGQTIANGTAVARANNFLTRSCELKKKGFNNTSEIFDISKSHIASLEPRHW